MASRRARLAVVFAALNAGALAAVFSCGGTTGREDIPGGETPAPESGAPPADATVVGEGGDLDASADASSPIMYADRVLPDIAVTPPSNGEAGPTHPGPDCPPFYPLPRCPDGGPPPLDTQLDELPSDYDDAGNVVPAPDGSACATYPWLGSLANDECATGNWDNTTNVTFYLPPCNWCGAEAGASNGGSRKGDPRQAICWDLYQCLSMTKCMSTGAISTCLCGDSGAVNCQPVGPCAAQELDALEYAPSDIQNATKNFTNAGADFQGRCGGAMNAVYQVLLSNAGPGSGALNAPACLDAGF